MLIPYRTLPDPETQGEGSIDPLGLATPADRLADWILPGMTARMWRPRFLTAIAAASLVVEPYGNELASDNVTPPWLVLEWYYVEALAAVREAGVGLRRVPGIDKARRALREGVPLSADRYLKTAKVFGFHGVYKRLARHVEVVDDELTLGENGYRLLRAWEVEQGLTGFADRERVEGDAAKLRKTLRDAVQTGLAVGQTTRRGQWPGALFFVEHLTPNCLGRREAELLWQLLITPAAEPRGEVFRLLREPAARQAFSEDDSERGIVEAVRSHASPELGRRLDAIQAYEGFCRPLMEGWDRLRMIATRGQPAVVRPSDMQQDPRATEIAAGMREAIERARERLAESPIDAEFETLALKFGDVRTGADLFGVLWEHHTDVQQGKPPDGKRRWLEELTGGALVVRPPYRLQEAPVREEFVHPYRLSAAVSFLDDLDGGA